MKETANSSVSEEVAKMLCLRALLQQSGPYDEALARHVKTAIDFALTGEVDKGAPLATFAEAAVKLMREQGQLPPSYGLGHLDLRGGHFDALWVRAEVVRTLKRLTGYRSAMLVVSGLEQALSLGKRVRAERQRRRRAEAMAYIDGLAARFTAKEAALTILYV